LRSTVRSDRAAGAAALAAAVALLIGGLAYDALRSLSSARPFWVLVAIGVAASEHARGPLPRLVVRDRRVLVRSLVVAELVGWVVAGFAPVHYARQYQFTTVSVLREAHPVDPVTEGTTLVHTVCGMVNDLPPEGPAASYDCRDLQVAAGVGELRVQSATPTKVASAVDLIQTQAATAELAAFQLIPENSLQRGRDTAAAWAPLWLPMATGLVLLLVPVGGRSRYLTSAKRSEVATI
jgi:hypothetical protein